MKGAMLEAGKNGVGGGMGLAGRAISAICSLPAPLRPPKATDGKVSRSLSEAGFSGEDAERYSSGAFIISVFGGALSFLPLLFVFLLPEAIAASLLIFALFFLILLNFPSLLAMRRQKEAESELPFLLRELAIYIDIGIPFEKAIAKIGAGNYALSREFAECAREINSGASVQAALSKFSAGTRSLALKRALLIISSIYETGAKAEQLKRMAEELSSSQLTDMRAQTGKFSMLAIAFIAASALLPSFFTVYAAVSPIIAGEAVPPLQFWLFFLLVFPFLDAVVLCAMLFMLPPAKPSRGREGMEAEYLQKKGVKNAKAALALLAASSLVLSAALFFSGLGMLSLFALAIAPAAYALASYAAQREIAEAEGFLPDALYGAAATHRLFSSEKMLSYLAKGNFGRLSEAFGIALARQQAGEGFEESMKAASVHCPSQLTKRAFSLLIVSHKTGAEMYAAMRETAQDVVSFFALVRERAALLSMQRYTVLASCALLVPAILGAVAYIAPSLSSASSLILPSANTEIPGLFLACQAYLVLNAALSSLLLALVETDPKKAALYFCACAPVAIAVFALVSAGALLPAL